MDHESQLIFSTPIIFNITWIFEDESFWRKGDWYKEITKRLYFNWSYILKSQLMRSFASCFKYAISVGLFGIGVICNQFEKIFNFDSCLKQLSLLIMHLSRLTSNWNDSK